MYQLLGWKIVCYIVPESDWRVLPVDQETKTYDNQHDP